MAKPEAGSASASNSCPNPEPSVPLTNALKGDLGVLGLAVPNPPMQAFDLRDDHRLGVLLLRGVGRQVAGHLPGVL
jgi:hypothetical protein